MSSIAEHPEADKPAAIAAALKTAVSVGASAAVAT